MKRLLFTISLLALTGFASCIKFPRERIATKPVLIDLLTIKEDKFTQILDTTLFKERETPWIHKKNKSYVIYFRYRDIVYVSISPKPAYFFGDRYEYGFFVYKGYPVLVKTEGVWFVEGIFEKTGQKGKYPFEKPTMQLMFDDGDLTWAYRYANEEFELLENPRYPY